MTSTNFNLRLDRELRDKAFQVFEQYGLSASQAFRLFLNQVAQTQQVPLSFDYIATQPNKETAEAICQGREDYAAGHLTGYEPKALTKALTGLVDD